MHSKKINDQRPEILEAVLELHGIHVHYGGVKALDGVNLKINPGEIVAIMGPNGAGKSTVLKAIFGLSSIDRGNIIWKGRELVPVPHQVVKEGISFVPQGRRVFAHLSVQENLEVAGLIVKNKQELKSRIENIMENFPVLAQKRKAKSGSLSGGQQQLLALARGLMTGPSLLLLDEPSLGLAPKIVKEIFEQIKLINARLGTAIIIVEHNIKSLFEFVDRAYVLDKGKVAAEGKAGELLGSDVLERVFLGKPVLMR